MSLPDNLTLDIVMDAVERRNSSLGYHPGFCLSCGEEADECEPDACNYECECCGEKQVFGAEEILISIA